MENIWNETILDDIQEMVYIVNAETFQLVEANKKIKQRFPKYCKGMKCYQLFYSANGPCQDCGIAKTMETNTEVRIIKELSQEKQRVQVVFHKYRQRENLCICTITDIPSSIKSSVMLENVLNGIRAATYVVNPKTY